MARVAFRDHTKPGVMQGIADAFGVELGPVSESADRGDAGSEGKVGNGGQDGNGGQGDTLSELEKILSTNVAERLKILRTENEELFEQLFSRARGEQKTLKITPALINAEEGTLAGSILSGPVSKGRLAALLTMINNKRTDS